MDVVAAAWSQGREPKKKLSELKTLKTVRPAHLLEGESVHYAWEIAAAPTPEIVEHVRILSLGAQSIIALGWGLDVVVATGRVMTRSELERIDREAKAWIPVSGDSTGSLRVPTAGTIEALMERHARLLGRIARDGRGSESLMPVPPLSVFRKISYRRPDESPTRPFAAFSLLAPDASGLRPFDSSRSGIMVAGMLRHAAADADVVRPLGWTPQHVAALVLGHAEDLGQPHLPTPGPRLAYVPLPSIEPRGKGGTEVVSSVRRAMIVGLNGCDPEEVRLIGRNLSGSELFRKASSEPVALLSRIPDSDRIVRRYTATAAVWSTVTPVVLPGFDDPKHYRRRLAKGLQSAEQMRLLEELARRTDGLVRKAIVQAGFGDDLAQNAEIAWRPTGFWPGVDLAWEYVVPQHLKRFPRYHVRIVWRDSQGNVIPLSGPVCLGGGRYYGLGLFAAEK